MNTVKKIPQNPRSSAIKTLVQQNASQPGTRWLPKGGLGNRRGRNLLREGNGGEN